MTVFFCLLNPFVVNRHSVIRPNFNVYVSASVKRERFLNLHRNIVSVYLSVTLRRVVGGGVITYYYVEFGDILCNYYCKLLYGGYVSVCHLYLIAYYVNTLDKIDVSKSFSALRYSLFGVDALNSRCNYEARIFCSVVSCKCVAFKVFRRGRREAVPISKAFNLANGKSVVLR